MQQGVFGQTQPPKGAVELPGSWRMSCALSTGRPEHAPAIPTAHSHRTESQTSGLEMQLQPDPHLDTPGPHPWPSKSSYTINAVGAELREPGSSVSYTVHFGEGNTPLTQKV